MLDWDFFLSFIFMKTGLKNQAQTPLHCAVVLTLHTCLSEGIPDLCHGKQNQPLCRLWYYFSTHTSMHAYVLSCFSCVWLSATPWTVAGQAPLSMGFSRKEYWSGLLCPSPGDLPNPGIEPASLVSPALAGRFFTASATWESLFSLYMHQLFYLKFFLTTEWSLTLY